MKRRWVLALLAVSSAVALYAGNVFATPLSGFSGTTLTPPPLPWLSCKPVGGGTICEGTRSVSYGPEDSGSACGAGPSAFVILDTATRHVRAQWTYDGQGYLVQRIFHLHYTSARVTNSLTGAELPYTQEETRTDNLAVPGDLGSAMTTYTGELIVGSPGGAPVLIGTGKIVLSPAGEIDFQAGPSGFADLLSGDPSALCAALS